jgi:methionyl-tRNA formyltransferase
MTIVLLCATRRGYLFLQKITELLPEANLIVFSFREELWEPPFLDNIHKLTLANAAQFFEDRQVGSKRWSQFWESTAVDLMFVVSWRYMIPACVYKRPRLGTFVFHDSLLPAYRGFSPTVWAIINGEDHTGVTLFDIAEEMDSGDIIDQELVPIGPDDTIAIVMERVTQTYLDLLERNIDNLTSGTAARYPQDHSRATYTRKRLPEDNEIDWGLPAEKIYNLVRAVTKPYPGAYTYLNGKKMYIWSANVLKDYDEYIRRIPGRVVKLYIGSGAVVLTGDNPLLIRDVQIEAHPIVCASDALNGVGLTLGR